MSDVPLATDRFRLDPTTGSGSIPAAGLHRNPTIGIRWKSPKFAGIRLSDSDRIRPPEIIGLKRIRQDPMCSFRPGL